jgi:hypothetical protein
LEESSAGKGRRRPRDKSRPRSPRARGEEDRMMKLAKRIVITLGSLAALALAGGAHFKF